MYVCLYVCVSVCVVSKIPLNVACDTDDQCLDASAQCINLACRCLPDFFERNGLCGNHTIINSDISHNEQFSLLEISDVHSQSKIETTYSKMKHEAQLPQR